MTTTRNSEGNRQFKQVTRSMVTGANYALASSGAANYAMVALGFLISIPSLFLWVIPAGVGLLCCAAGIYNQAHQPDREEAMEQKLDEIKEGIEEVLEQHEGGHRRASQVQEVELGDFKSGRLFRPQLVNRVGSAPPRVLMDERAEQKSQLRLG